MNNEERMHAFRLTPCCIRVVYAVDNLKGYIPMSKSDPGYLQEIEREKSLGMPACRCSTCEPEAAAQIIRLLPHTKSADLAALLASSLTSREDVTAFQPVKTAVKRKASAGIPLVCKLNDPIRLNKAMIELSVLLVEGFEELFRQTYPSGCHMRSTTLFKLEDAWQIVNNYVAVSNGVFLREILGGERLPGHYNSINECIQRWFRSDSFKQDQEELEDIQIKNDQEILDLELLEEEHHEQLRLKAAEKALKDAAIAERKRIREENAAEAERVKEEKREHRQKEMALREEARLQKAQLKASAKAIKDAEKAIKDAGIAERKKAREDKKIQPPSLQG
ncbi:hypothetical protein DFH28DRAFT_913805 [Melampsora americana]|nr:hypothetical protein DFH28DRAFT_913805 [Melampsora americana]